MEKLKNLVTRVTSFITSLTPWMSSTSWLGTFAFALGFLFGSEGEWAGTIFFTIFWIVGLFIWDGYSKMNSRNDETEGN